MKEHRDHHSYLLQEAKKEGYQGMKFEITYIFLERPPVAKSLGRKRPSEGNVRKFSCEDR